MKNCKMSEYTEQRNAVYPGLTKITDRDEELGYVRKRGVIEHILGLVAFDQYRQWPTGHRLSGSPWRSLRLWLVHGGKEYVRYWDAWYGEKTIARLANEFIEEIKGGQ